MSADVPLPLVTLVSHISMKAVEIASCASVVAVTAAHVADRARGNKTNLLATRRPRLVRGIWSVAIPAVALLAATRISGYAEPRYEAIADRAFALQGNEGQLAVDASVLATAAVSTAIGPLTLQRLSVGIAVGVIVGSGISAWRRTSTA
mmetsp:Transcript_1839/g.5861  ORF Transcript_1839/g.5861 Transcript_1839/m.5861 type:complete len:149 (-) Transcript_1839:43-489(-)